MTKILVIEDESPLRDSIQEYLTFGGYDVLTAVDGQDGIEKASQFCPDLIVCDISMPNMDGYEVLELVRLQEKTSLTPFIFLTAHAQEEYRRKGMGNGADDFLTKPFTTHDLLSSIESRLKRQKAYFSEVESVKKTLSMMIAHELRTPLTSMVTALDIIESILAEIPESDLHDLIPLVRSGSTRMHRVVEQLVMKTEIETSGLSYEKLLEAGISVRGDDLVNYSVNHAKQFALRNKDAHITTTINAPEAEVFGNNRALFHAISEIIINALHFSEPEQSVNIEQWSDEATLFIQVSDFGRGIPKNRLDEAYQPFVQIDREKFEQQGIGIGLWLARNIVEIHQGQIDIESSLGEGTQVIIQLPIKKLI